MAPSVRKLHPRKWRVYYSPAWHGWFVLPPDDGLKYYFYPSWPFGSLPELFAALGSYLAKRTRSAH